MIPVLLHPIRRLHKAQAAQGGGDLVHNETFVVTGTGFGTKSSSSAPTIADYGDAGAGVVDAQWDGAWPSTGTSTYYMLNRAISHANGGSGDSGVPHSNCSIALCGAHGSSGTGSGGQQVVAWREFTWDGSTEYSYWSCYLRAAPNWVFGANPPPPHGSGSDDNNYKTYGISEGFGGIYNLPDNWYESFNTPRPVSSSDLDQDGGGSDVGIEMVLGDDRWGAGEPYNLPIGDHWSDNWNGVNYASAWAKWEFMVRWEEDSTGWIKGWVNNKQVWDKSGWTTDTMRDLSNNRSEGIGGFVRQYGHAQNWRYFVDIYHSRDANSGRFVLTNHATYASATIVEVQPYTSWSATSVTLKCKKGGLSSGTVHLHFRQEDGSHQYLGTRTMT